MVNVSVINSVRTRYSITNVAGFMTLVVGSKLAKGKTPLTAGYDGSNSVSRDVRVFPPRDKMFRPAHFFLTRLLRTTVIANDISSPDWALQAASHSARYGDIRRCYRPLPLSYTVPV